WPATDFAREICALEEIVRGDCSHAPTATASEGNAGFRIFKRFLECDQHVTGRNANDRSADCDPHLRVDQLVFICENVVAGAVNNRRREIGPVLIGEADTSWLLLRRRRQAKGDVYVSTKFLRKQLA